MTPEDLDCIVEMNKQGIPEYPIPVNIRITYEQELHNWIKDGWLIPYPNQKLGPSRAMLSQKETVKKAYLDDIYINEDISPALHIQVKLAQFGLDQEDAACVLGLHIRGEEGTL